MTTLYKPVTIETAEQAEALPVGAVAMFPGEPSAAVRVDYGLGWHIAGHESSDDHGYMTGWSALVPIEAEETWGIADADGTTYRAQSEEHARRWQKTMGTALAQRYITPWQEADQ